MIVNLKRNWYFPFLAMAFFCLNGTQTFECSVGLCFVFGIAIVVASNVRSFIDIAKQSGVILNIISAMTAIGVCWSERFTVYADNSMICKIQSFESTISTLVSLDTMSWIFVFAAAIFVYFCVLMFWKKLIEIISDGNIFSDISVAEMIVYGIIIAASLVFMAIAFAQTNAFYGTEYSFDVVYTGDSSILVKSNVYTVLMHRENDLRQPLFAVFSAPFMGIAYLFIELFGVSAFAEAVLLDVIQILMMFFANFVLTRMMKLDSVKRICFMLLSSCTYTYLLFSLMMEQYIIAYFWLILCIYQISEKRRPDDMILWGAGGTLLTGMILMPSMSEKNPIKQFKGWVSDMIDCGLKFVIVILAFNRFDVIYNMWLYAMFFGQFSGTGVAFIDRAYQYTAFVSNCFTAPNAGVSNVISDHISWQLNPVTFVNILGIILLLLTVISFVLNRNKRSSRLAVGWIMFSVVILFAVGWGTIENGLILYSLYFGWAFFVLLFQLIEKVENALKTKFLIPLISVGCAVMLAIINIPAVIDIINFGRTYYPR